MSTQATPHELSQFARSRGLHVKARSEAGIIVAASIYQNVSDNRAIVTWERDSGIVRRLGMTWVPCSLGEAKAIMAYAHLAKTQVAPSENATGQGNDACDNVLEDPRMDGVQWIWPDFLLENPDYLDSWPLWERWNNGCNPVIVVRPAALGVKDGGDGYPQWRPLRLPGMNERGEVPASAMTPEHFERVARWQWGDLREPGRWNTMMWKPSIHDVDPRADVEIWRPAIFAKLDRAKPESETK